jgi:drug/metabolite transporter (DMT)-like permease
MPSMNAQHTPTPASQATPTPIPNTGARLPLLTRRQLWTLIALTVVWGLNWPIMKLGVTGFPPLTFRSLSMIAGLPLLGLALAVMKVPFRIPRAHWRELLVLSVFNMFVWHILVILAIPLLSSGRAAILGYTMPIFSAMCGVWWFKAPLRPRQWLGVLAAAVGVLLLLWNELTHFAGQPVGVLMVLVAAATWAYGTQRLRHTHLEVPTLTIAFWMTTLTTLLMIGLSVATEQDRWQMPTTSTAWAIAYNAVGVFAFAQAAWLTLARGLPPVASTLSVMFIPVLGVFSGAWVLGEVLHWQDWTAVALMVVAIASVLWPAKSS